MHATDSTTQPTIHPPPIHAFPPPTKWLDRHNMPLSSPPLPSPPLTGRPSPTPPPAESAMEPLAPENNDPFIQFRKGMEPLERVGARKLRPLFLESDGTPIKDYIMY